MAKKNGWVTVSYTSYMVELVPAKQNNANGRSRGIFHSS